MNFRLPLCLCLCLAAAPLRAAAPKSAAEAEPGLLQRTASLLWPFGKKKTAATPAPVGQPGTQWKKLTLSILVEPLPIKLAETRTLKVTLQLANKGPKLVQLDFPTTQRIEVAIKDPTGKTVEQWSQDQSFTAEPSQVAINPGERLEYTANVATRELKAGEVFTVEGFFPNYDQLRASKSITPEP